MVLGQQIGVFCYQNNYFKREERKSRERNKVFLWGHSPQHQYLLSNKTACSCELSGSIVSYTRYRLGKELGTDTQKSPFQGQEYRIMHFIAELTEWLSKIWLESKNIHITVQASKAAMYCSLHLSRDFMLFE